MRSRPSGVLLDLMMPRLGGLDALKHIRQFDATLPVVVMTGFLDEDLRPAHPAPRSSDSSITPVKLVATGPVMRTWPSACHSISSGPPSSTTSKYRRWTGSSVHQRSTPCAQLQEVRSTISGRERSGTINACWRIATQPRSTGTLPLSTAGWFVPGWTASCRGTLRSYVTIRRNSVSNACALVTCS